MCQYMPVVKLVETVKMWIIKEEKREIQAAATLYFIFQFLIL